MTSAMNPQLNRTDRAFHAAVSRIAETIGSNPPEDWAKARPLAQQHGATYLQATAVESRLRQDHRVETIEIRGVVHVRRAFNVAPTRPKAKAVDP